MLKILFLAILLGVALHVIAHLLGKMGIDFLVTFAMGLFIQMFPTSIRDGTADTRQKDWR